jgi:hypothetical protein
MFLNAKNNNFRFEFQTDFFYPPLVEKYEYVIKKLPSPIKKIRDYINAGIQEVTFPSSKLPIVTQQNLHNPETPWKGMGNMEKHITKEFTVTFKLYEGYINYWIMFEQLNYFYEYTTLKQAYPDIVLSFMDNVGFELFAFKFGRVLFNGISDLSLSFSSNVPEFNTFTCDFTYTTFELLKRLQ